MIKKPKAEATTVAAAFAVASIVPLVTEAIEWRYGESWLTEAVSSGVILACGVLATVLVEAGRRRLIAAMGEIERNAATDALTSIGNRSAFEQRSEELRAAKGGGVVVVADVDRLKRVNDERGHAAGDSLLRDVARVLMAAAQPGGGIVYRTGGDEFTVLFAGGSAEDIPRLTERIASGAATLGGGAGISVGSAILIEGDVRSAIETADAEMYAVKRAARR